MDSKRKEKKKPVLENEYQKNSRMDISILSTPSLTRTSS